MKLALALSVTMLLFISVMTTITVWADNPPVSPAPIPTTTAFAPLPVDTIFLGVVRTASPDSTFWTKVSDNTLINLGHSVALVFKAYGGLLVCIKTSSDLWSIAPNTARCRDAESKTVSYLDKVAIDNALKVTHTGNVYFTNAATALYLTW